MRISDWSSDVCSSDLVEPLTGAQGAPLLVDALFGTGLTRPLDERTSTALSRLVSEAAVRVAIDLPSGVATDDGGILSPVPGYDLTVTFAARKPSPLQIGRAHVCTPVHNAPLVCRL